jgi:perosamine synthetase
VNELKKSSMLITHSRPTIDQEDIKRVTEVLASGRIAQGEEVKRFENSVANFVGAKYAVACSSGTSALHLALIGLGIKPGDEVLLPSYVCTSPFLAVKHAGATPRIADIDISDFNICAATAKNQLSAKTKAIIVPHLFGTAAELDELRELGVPLVEDCAQSLGAEYKKRKVGSIGELSAFSFYATKMITTGEGGMVVTNQEEFYQRALEAREYDRKPLSPTKYNYKMTDFQAALGLSQMTKLEDFINRRRKLASLYNECFDCTVVTPHLYRHRNSVFFRYVVLVDNVDLVRDLAKQNQINCEKPVYKPLHDMVGISKCPCSDQAFNHALSIPIYPSLNDDQAAYLTQILSDIFKNVCHSHA